MLYFHSLRSRPAPPVPAAARGCGCLDPVSLGHDCCFTKADSSALPARVVSVCKFCRCRECPCTCHKIPA